MITCSKINTLRGRVGANTRRACSLAVFRVFCKSLAFTLAEVLITLGIVGVVAAMVIPSLISNIREQIINNQFKKSYAVVVNALKMVSNEGYYCAYKKEQSTLASGSQCAKFFGSIPDFVRMQSVCKGDALEKGCIPKYTGKLETKSGGCPGFSQEYVLNRDTAYVFADNTTLITYGPTGHLPIFILDVNGHGRPNKLGYDAFIFRMVQDEIDNFKLIGDGCDNLIEKGGRTGNKMLKLLIKK